MEPMLLEDYKHHAIPASVTNLLHYYIEHNIGADKSDIIVGFLYILMLESGFVHKDCSDTIDDSDFNYSRVLKYSKRLPPNWTQTRYQIDFILKSAPDITCTIICVPLSDDLLINCVLKDCPDRYSLLVDPLMYFTTSKVNLGTVTFQNLNHLSRVFKNSIAFPAKFAIVSAVSGVCACFQHLPHEILLRIFGFLNCGDVLNVAYTCKVMCVAAQDPALWVKLLDRDFKKKHIYKTREELKFLYEIKYARELAKILAKGPSY